MFMVEGVIMGIIIILTEHVRTGKIKESIMLGKAKEEVGFFCILFFNSLRCSNSSIIRTQIR